MYYFIVLTFHLSSVHSFTKSFRLVAPNTNFISGDQSVMYSLI